MTIVAVFLLLACSNQNKDELLASGIGHLKTGNSRGAIVCLRSALELDPNYYEARYHLGDAYLQAGQYQQAEHEFEKVYRQNATYSDLLLKLAQVYRQTDRPDKSIEFLDTLHQNSPPSAESLDLLGVVNVLKQQFQVADALFKRASELDHDNPQPVFHLAQSYLSQSMNSQASSALDQMLDDFPNFSPAYELLAELYLSQNRIEDAITIYRRLYQADPANIQALYMRGLLLLTIDRSTEAVGVVEIMTTRFPDDYRGEQLLGMEAYKTGRYDDALVHLRQSLKSQPHTLTYYYLGLSHFRQNEFELAINQYQRVLDAQPDSSQARLMLAMTFLMQKRVEDCLQQTRYVLKNDPKNGLAYNILGSAYLLQNNYDEALSAFSQAIDLAPELIDVHLKKSRSYTLRGESDMAERELVTALAKSPQVLNTRLILASHHVRLSHYAAAATVLQKGLAGSSSDALIFSFLAGIADKQNRPSQAIAYLQKAKVADPAYITPYLKLAAYYLVQGETGQAIDEYRSLLNRDSDNVRALVELGLTYALAGQVALMESTFARLEDLNQPEACLEYARYQIRQGNAELALESLDRGLKLDAGNKLLVRAKAGVLLQQGRVDEAVRSLGQLEMDEPGVRNRILGNYLISRKEHAKAKLLAKKVEQANPASAYGTLLLASVLEAEDDLSQAQALIDKRLSTDPNNAELLLRSALLNEKRKAVDEAVVVYLDLMRSHPRFYPAHFALGSLYDRRGDKDAARRFYQQTIAINDGFVPALNNLAYLLLESDRPEEAIALALQAYRMAPGEPGVLDTLGLAMLKNKMFDESSRVLERARTLSQNNPTICFHLALAYLDMQRPDLARVELERALESDAFPEAARCRELLKKIRS